MYDDSHVYDISFVDSDEHPALVITMHNAYLKEVLARLEVLVDRNTDRIQKYLGEEVSFVSEETNLFGETLFGFEGCGRIVLDDTLAAFHLPYTQHTIGACALTLQFLTHVLSVPMGDTAVKTNRKQHVSIHTVCDPERHFHAHSAGGYVSSIIVTGLCEYADGETVSVPKEVMKAMHTAWKALTPSDMHRWVSECRGCITSDGRFMLQCLGNACDLSIYPDQMYTDGNVSVAFACHNVDSAMQQLTLLAGFASLCEYVLGK